MTIPILYFDGGSRGNPGKAAGAAVIVMPDGTKHTVTKFLGIATNNEAEYTGLIIGLQKALDLELKSISIKGDSNLVVNQLQGKWKIKSDRLFTLCHSAKQLARQFQQTTVDWIPRQENSLADRAVNKCLDLQ